MLLLLLYTMSPRHSIPMQSKTYLQQPSSTLPAFVHIQCLEKGNPTRAASELTGTIV